MTTFSHIKTAEVRSEGQEEPKSHFKRLLVIVTTIAVTAALMGLTYLPDTVAMLNGH